MFRFLFYHESTMYIAVISTAVVEVDTYYDGHNQQAGGNKENYIIFQISEEISLYLDFIWYYEFILGHNTGISILIDHKLYPHSRLFWKERGYPYQSMRRQVRQPHPSQA